MIESLKFKVNEMCFVGDLHGDFTAIRSLIKRLKITDTLFVFCGDIGMGFHKPEYYRQTLGPIDKLCKSTNNYCVFVRGNHDDDEYFNGMSDEKIKALLPFGEKFYKSSHLGLKNIFLVPDYTILEVTINENDYHPQYTETVLCVGGGISIDRTHRIRQMMADYHKLCRHMPNNKAEEHAMRLYWDNEAPVFDLEKLKEIIGNDYKISIVATHTAPSFCPPVTKDGIAGWLLDDDKLEEDLNKERKVMDDILDFLVENEQPLKDWYYGHFHFRDLTEVNNVRYWLLDMCRNNNLFYRIHNGMEW